MSAFQKGRTWCWFCEVEVRQWLRTQWGPICAHCAADAVSRRVDQEASDDLAALDREAAPWVGR